MDERLRSAFRVIPLAGSHVLGVAAENKMGTSAAMSSRPCRPGLAGVVAVVVIAAVAAGSSLGGGGA